MSIFNNDLCEIDDYDWKWVPLNRNSSQHQDDIQISAMNQASVRVSDEIESGYRNSQQKESEAPHSNTVKRQKLAEEGTPVKPMNDNVPKSM